MIFKTNFIRNIRTMNISKKKLFQKNVFSLTNFEQCVITAENCLKRKEIIALPTDTIYGLCGNAQSSEAVAKLYEIKGRDLTKPIAICVSHINEISKYGRVDHISKTLLSQLLPGPVTIVVHRTEKLNDKLNPGLPLVGIRIPDSKFIQNLSARLHFPLALTSANISNDISSVTVDEFFPLWSELGAVFDGGKIGEAREGSTILDLSVFGRYKIIRSGCNLKSSVEILHKYGYSRMS